MDYHILHKEFLALIKEKFPKGFNKARLIADTLDLNDRTVYRKMNGEIQFSFLEVVTLAKTFDLPLEKLYSESYQKMKHPMDIYTCDLTDSNFFYKTMEETIKTHEYANSADSSRYFCMTNHLPHIEYLSFDLLAKFAVLKWVYFNKGRKSAQPLSSYIISDKDNEIRSHYKDSINNFQQFYYVLNVDMISNIGKELQFFCQCNFISNQEAVSLIEELHAVVDKIEGFCIDEYSSDRELNIFYSDLSLWNDITLLQSENLNLAMIYASSFNPIVTKAPETYNLIKTWVMSRINSSTMISTSGQKQMSAFISKQRSDLQTLRSHFE